MKSYIQFGAVVAGIISLIVIGLVIGYSTGILHKSDSGINNEASAITNSASQSSKATSDLTERILGDSDSSPSSSSISGSTCNPVLDKECCLKKADYCKTPDDLKLFCSGCCELISEGYSSVISEFKACAENVKANGYNIDCGILDGKWGCYYLPSMNVICECS